MDMEAYGCYVAIVVVQFANAGGNILIKISLDKGLNQVVFVFYRHIIAMFVLGPFAYVLERKQRPRLSFAVTGKIFVLALFGTTVHLNLFYAGLKYTSPTVAIALSNIIPSSTFLMAFLLRMEKVKITSARGRAKVLGAIICIGGSLLFTFWKGKYLTKSFVERPLINIYDHNNCNTNDDQLNHQNWIKGSALSLTSYISMSVWLILQAIVFKDYPAPLSMNTLICFFASLQSSVLVLFFGRNPTSWKLDWNLQLLTIIYYGVVVTAFVYYLQTWCISIKGPVFPAMFIPLQLVIVALFSTIAFAERLHIGSLVGAALIIVGLYLVLWGKKTDSQLVDEEKDDEKHIDDGDNKITEELTNGCTLSREKSNQLYV